MPVHVIGAICAIIAIAFFAGFLAANQPLVTVCNHDLYSGWAKLTDVEFSSRAWGSQTFTAKMKCYRGLPNVWETVVYPGPAISLDGCPAEASPESLNATGAMMRQGCELPPRYTRMSIMPIFKRPDRTPVVIPETHILDSIELGLDGNISLVDQFAYPVVKRLGDCCSPRLWVAWRQKTTEGALTFQRIDSNVWRAPSGVPRSPRTYPVERKHFPNRNVSVVLRRISAAGTNKRNILMEASVVPDQDNPPVVLEGEDDRCSICLTMVDPAVNPPQLCRHWFHVSCLGSWLAVPGVKRKCPVCRQPLLPAMSTMTTTVTAVGPGQL